MEENCIQIERYSELSKKVKVDRENLASAILGGLLRFATPNPATQLFALQNVWDAFKSFKKTTKVEQQAFQLLYAALTETVNALLNNRESIFSEAGIKETSGGEMSKAKQDEFTQELNRIFNEKDYKLCKGFFLQPASNAFVEDIKAFFGKVLKENGLTREQCGIVISHFDEAFVSQLNTICREKPALYEELEKRLGEKFDPTPTSTRGAYNRMMIQNWSKEIFGQGFGLDQLYVPLRLRYELKNNEEYKYTVRDAGKHILDWMREKEPPFQLMVLKGGPGSGKSSLMKFLAKELALEGRADFYLIPLHELDISEKVRTSVHDYLEHNLELAEAPFSNNGQAQGGARILLFDGLDELSLGSSSNLAAATKFLTELEAQIGSSNKLGVNIRALVTGRDPIIEEFQKDFDTEGQVPELMSLEPWGKNGGKEEDFKDKYLDGTLAEEDQRSLWWNNYWKPSKPRDNLGGVPELFIENDKLEPLTHQPLLNFLLAFSYVHDRQALSTAKGENQLYEILVNRVRQRKVPQKLPDGTVGEDRISDHQAIKDSILDKAEFFKLMEEVGASAWHHGDNKVTSFARLKERGPGVETLLEKITNSQGKEEDAGHLRLLTAFFFKKGLHPDLDSSFEFTHRTFGEYFAARRIYALALELCEKDGLWENKNSQWVKLCGPQAMTEKMWDFLQAEIALRMEEKGREDAGFPRRFHKSLCAVFGQALDQGLDSSHIIPHRHHTVLRRSRNALETLWLCIAAAANVALPDLKFKDLEDEARKDFTFIQWPEGFSIFEFQSFMQVGGVAPLANQAYVHLYAPVGKFEGLQLIGANFRNSYLIRANLTRANLKEANLEGANLEGANLEGANLIRKNLRGAYLRGAYLRGANLRGANLRGAYLESAYLTRAYLFGANLGSANLEQANLELANLEQANLGYTILKGAKLEGADLTHATLEGAILRSTDYHKAHIPQAYYHGRLYTQEDHLPAILAYLAGEGPEPKLTPPKS